MFAAQRIRVLRQQNGRPGIIFKSFLGGVLSKDISFVHDD